MAAERVTVRRVGRGGSGGEQPSPGRGPKGPRGEGAGCGWLLVRWLVSALSIYLAAWLLDPHVYLEGPLSALFVAAMLGLLNAFVRPFMVLFTLPITVFTLGLFLIVINAVLLVIAALLSPGFGIDHFGWALLAALVISVIHLLLDAFVRGFAGDAKRP